MCLKAICKDMGSLRSPPLVLLPGSIQPSALGFRSHHTSSMVQFHAWVGIPVAKRGNAFTFFALGITLPVLLLVLKQFALESAEQQGWRNRPSRNTQVRKKSVCPAGSYPLAQPCHRTLGPASCLVSGSRNPK